MSNWIRVKGRETLRQLNPLSMYWVVVERENTRAMIPSTINGYSLKFDRVDEGDMKHITHVKEMVRPDFPEPIGEIKDTSYKFT